MGDPAFALEPAGTDARPPERPVTLLALRSWKRDDALRAAFAGDVLARLGPGAGAQITMFPMHVPDDDVFMRAVHAGSGSGTGVHFADWQASGDTPSRALARFGAAHLVVAMRLHALIFAARCGVPFVALSYDPKVDALAHAAGQEDALVPVETLTGEALLEAADRVRATRAERAERLQTFAGEQAERARRPAQTAAEWLRR